MPTRRTFLKTTLAAAGLGVAGAARATPRTSLHAEPRAKKSILILGGTSFLGPACVEAAKARGHSLTLFNRGKRDPGIFPDLEKLIGDRDPLKGAGLKALADRKWDAVIDTSGYYPRIVKASAELLAPIVGHYIFVSTLSVYAENATENADETAALATMADPTVETMGKDFVNYGPLKALCEQAAEKAMPGRVASVRPTYIVGPRDPSDRFTYWPVRMEHGGEAVAPGTPDDPIQIIDVRDLGAWIIRLIEDRTTGVFNAVGPATRLRWGDLLESCRKASKAPATLKWVAPDVLQKFVKKDDDVTIPIWIVPSGESKGFHTRSCARAVKAGLTYRSVPDTVEATLAWFKTLPDERRAKLRAGLSPELEARILAAAK